MLLLSSSPSISSSSSSLSSSTLSFDPTIFTWKSATAGCIAGILRRILCSRSLPTHTSGHITESSSIASYKKKPQISNIAVDRTNGDDSSQATPGVVARLMGLDSLPEINLLNPNSISRSRFMNSADYNQHTDSIHVYIKHRRVSSTLSFRDMPTYLELENEEFFVLSFEKKREPRSSKGRKFREESKENRVEEKTPDKKSKQDPVMNEDKTNGAKLRKKKKKIKQHVDQNEEPAECVSEDSSPVSVIDFDQFIVDHCVSVPEEKFEAKGSNSNTRRKLSAELENYGCKSSPSNDGNLMGDDQSVSITEGEWRGNDEENLECWDEICRMIEGEVGRSSWLWSRNEDLDHITADFESAVLDQLLDEVVVQLF